MKKILSLLSVMTISATAVPTTIAASPYQKQENKLKSNEINNLEILDRNKRDGSDTKHYYISNGNVFYKEKKIKKIYKSIKKIIVANNNSSYFISEDGYVYFLFWNWCCEAERIDTYYKLPEITNVKSIHVAPNNTIYYNTSNGVYRISYGSSWKTEKVVYEEVKDIWFYSNNQANYQYKEDLNNIITNIQLGELNDNNKYTILAAVKQKNSVLDINGLKINEITSTSANIYSDKNDYHNSFKYKGNKKVYFTFKEDLNLYLININLNLINNSSDKAILNELSYLNPELDISQLEVINSTNISATIKAKNDSNKYHGEKKIYYLINDQPNKIINLDELIKKGIFFNFRDKNNGTNIKEIKNINTNNLIYSNVTATKDIEPIYNKNNRSICFGTTTLFHDLPEKQNMKTPSCKYTKETTISTQITTNFSKEETTSKTKDTKHNWNHELGVNIHQEGGIWPFAKVSTDINSKFGTGGENGTSETKILSNKFDFSNNKTDEFKESSEVELPSQEIEVKPNQKIKLTASLEEILAQVTLNLKQNIYGEINAKVVTSNNEEKTITLSIKKIMQKLSQYNLLPQEITINNNDSITFNGKANRSLKQGFAGHIQFSETKN